MNELKSQLGTQQRVSSAGTSYLDDELFGTSQSAKRTSAIEQHKEQIRKAEKDRREAHEVSELDKVTRMNLARSF